MSALGTKLYTLLWGEKVGEDKFGNRYYRLKNGKKYKASLRQQRRWVLYKGQAEASKVPAEWHAWIHYTVNDVPQNDGQIYDWQKDHLPNLSGTELAYRPPGHGLSDKPRAKTGADYQAWTPE
ncbi:MAG: NADH:ubiquinone oxidoreductase subunit NDUFA12 [Alphaproteobacteria bacterium]